MKPAAKMSVRQRVREHETLLKGMAQADNIIREMDMECARLERANKRLRWLVATTALFACIVGVAIRSAFA